MANVYFDHDVAVDTVILLRSFGHTVISTRELGLERAKDDVQLLTAAQRGLILVTHNRKDFELLHDAWRHWSAAWGAAPKHSGVLIIPQPPMMSYERVAQELHAFIESNTPLTNELHVLRPATGWTRRS